ncbi:MAG: ABC transporter permease [Candidatus Hydrogenedentes bacterium]|nr:ABC transporter permease [Candidatus Hydrogenedentota bacterium]
MFVFPTIAILRREFAANLRRTRTFYFVLLLLSLAVLVTTTYWPSERLTIRMAASTSEQIVTLITLLLFYGCALVVPALGAASITVEREQDTFDMLYLSLIRPKSILLGKLLNTCGVYLVVVLAALPVFASALFAVGLDTRQLLYAFVILIMLALYCGTIGILMSTLFTRGIVALVASYILVAILMGGPRFLIAAIFSLLNIGFYSGRLAGGFGPAGSYSLFTFYSPAGTTFSLLNGTLTASAFVAAISVQLGFVYLGLSIASRRLRRQSSPKLVRNEVIIDDAEILEARRKQFPYYLIDPSRRRATIEDGRNPMMVREIRWGLFARGSTLIRVFYVTATVFGFIFIAITMFADPSDYAGTFAWAISLELLTLVSFAPVIMANSFTKERELGNIDMLRMTLLQPSDIVRGKAVAGVFVLLPVIAAIAIAAIPMILVDFSFSGMVLAFYATMPICALMAVSLGLLVSLQSQRTNSAIAGGIILNAIFFLGIGLLYFLYLAFSQSQSRQALYPMDLMPYISLVGGYYVAFASSRGPLTGWILSQVQFLVLALVLLKLAERIFHARHMRDV